MKCFELCEIRWLKNISGTRTFLGRIVAVRLGQHISVRVLGCSREKRRRHTCTATTPRRGSTMEIQLHSVLQVNYWTVLSKYFRSTSKSDVQQKIHMGRSKTQFLLNEAEGMFWSDSCYYCIGLSILHLLHLSVRRASRTIDEDILTINIPNISSFHLSSMLKHNNVISLRFSAIPMIGMIGINYWIWLKLEMYCPIRHGSTEYHLRIWTRLTSFHPNIIQHPAAV